MRVIKAVAATLFLAQAAIAEIPARVEDAFRNWTRDVGTDAAVLTLWHEGEERNNINIGMAPDTAVALGSLGKAVTALCAATLIRDRTWTPATTAREVLGYGAADVTVGGLMTHASGLGPDQTQGMGLAGFFGSRDAPERVARRALDRKPQDGTPGRYSYNNENYMVLGQMIAAETDTSYVQYCTEAVLEPAGVANAAPHPRLGLLLAAGGWQMPVQGYAALMEWGFGPNGLIGSDPDAWPEADVGGGAAYGPGMLIRDFRDGHNFWHFGLLCFPERAEAGSYAVRFENGWMAVVGFDGCLDWDQLFALDTALARAVYE